MRSLLLSSAGNHQPLRHGTYQNPAPTLTFPQEVLQPPTDTGPILVSNDLQHNPLLKPISFFNIQNDSLFLSAGAKNNVTRAIQGGWADSTLRRYTGTIKQFIRFCNEERVQEHMRFPADEFVLCAFAASSLGRHAGGTPRSRITTLKAWHAAHNVRWKGSTRLHYVLSGVHNFAPTSSRQVPRPPVNAVMLVLLIQNLDLNSPLDATVAACATSAFWGQCRLGELLPLSHVHSNLPSSPLPTHSSFRRSLPLNRQPLYIDKENLPQTMQCHLVTLWLPSDHWPLFPNRWNNRVANHRCLSRYC